MKLVYFGPTSIQKGRRVVLDSKLMKNCNVSEGETVDLFFDVQNEHIVIKKHKQNEIKNR